MAAPTGMGTGGTATSRASQGFKAVASCFWQCGGMQTPERSLLALTSATAMIKILTPLEGQEKNLQYRGFLETILIRPLRAK